MPSSDQPSIAEPSMPACGNCGVPVRTADITCPACGVLLAAYQAPAGAAGNEAIATAPAQFPGDTSATHDVATPAMTSPLPPTAPEPTRGSPPERPTPPRHQPRSQSPIGDALRRSTDARATNPDALGSAEIADELARMAMSDSALAREVEAELAGAKVTFDGDDAMIETDQVDLTHDPEGAPVVAAHAPASAHPQASAPATASTQLPQSGSGSATSARPQPVRPAARVIPAPGERTMEATATPVDQRPATGHFDPATMARWIPFILIGCVMLVVGRSLPGFGGLIGFALVIGLIYLLVKVAAASSRKTTTMPRDDSWSTKRSRWRK